jgi:hypothetical protein
MEISLAAVRKLLSCGDVAVGDLDSNGFTPWSMSNDDAVREIERRWIALGHEPDIGDVCWFSAVQTV